MALKQLDVASEEESWKKQLLASMKVDTSIKLISNRNSPSEIIKLAMNGKSVIPKIVPLINDQNQIVRENAIRVLGLIKDPTVIDSLLSVAI